MQKYHFIVTEKEGTRKYSRMYGGSDYTLVIYSVNIESPGKELKYIGKVSACTRADKGEISEAWTEIRNHLPPALLKRIEKLDSSYASYYANRIAEKFGVRVSYIGQ